MSDQAPRAKTQPAKEGAAEPRILNQNAQMVAMMLMQNPRFAKGLYHDLCKKDLEVVANTLVGQPVYALFQKKWDDAVAKTIEALLTDAYRAVMMEQFAAQQAANGGNANQNFGGMFNPVMGGMGMGMGMPGMFPGMGFGGFPGQQTEGAEGQQPGFNPMFAMGGFGGGFPGMGMPGMFPGFGFGQPGSGS